MVKAIVLVVIVVAIRPVRLPTQHSALNSVNLIEDKLMPLPLWLRGFVTPWVTEEIRTPVIQVKDHQLSIYNQHKGAQQLYHCTFRGPLWKMRGHSLLLSWLKSVELIWLLNQMPAGHQKIRSFINSDVVYIVTVLKSV